MRLRCKGGAGLVRNRRKGFFEECKLDVVATGESGVVKGARREEDIPPPANDPTFDNGGFDPEDLPDPPAPLPPRVPFDPFSKHILLLVANLGKANITHLLRHLVDAGFETRGMNANAMRAFIIEKGEALPFHAAGDNRAVCRSPIALLQQVVRRVRVPLVFRNKVVWDTDGRRVYAHPSTAFAWEKVQEVVGGPGIRVLPIIICQWSDGVCVDKGQTRSVRKVAVSILGYDLQQLRAHAGTLYLGLFPGGIKGNLLQEDILAALSGEDEHMLYDLFRSPMGQNLLPLQLPSRETVHVRPVLLFLTGDYVEATAVLDVKFGHEVLYKAGDDRKEFTDAGMIARRLLKRDTRELEDQYRNKRRRVASLAASSLGGNTEVEEDILLDSTLRYASD